MRVHVDKKKATLWGAVTIVIQLVVGNILWMNPIVANLNKQFEGHPSIKSFDFLGGMTNWVLVTFLFGIFLSIVFIVLYPMLYAKLPGEGWSKGLAFGAILAFIKAVPEAFNQWMVIVYPWELIVLQLVNTVLGLLIFGTILGALFRKFKVIQIGVDK